MVSATIKFAEDTGRLNVKRDEDQRQEESEPDDGDESEDGEEEQRERMLKENSESKNTTPSTSPMQRLSTTGNISSECVVYYLTLRLPETLLYPPFLLIFFHYVYALKRGYYRRLLKRSCM